MKNVLTIAGSDPSGGAGIQADLKTMCALGVFGMTAIAAITVQNTREVRDFQEVDPAVVAGQVDAVYSDIRVDAVKIGMIGNDETVRAVRDALLRHRARNIVLDPVMVSKSGCRLLRREVERELVALFPLADVVTPNLLEAEALSGKKIASHDDMLEAAKRIREAGARNVLVKGGDPLPDRDDLLLAGDDAVWLRGPRLDTNNTHGTGCTLSAAIACFLAKGLALPEAAAAAKKYVTQAIRDGGPLGGGVGVLAHLARLYEKAGIANDD